MPSPQAGRGSAAGTLRLQTGIKADGGTFSVASPPIQSDRDTTAGRTPTSLLDCQSSEALILLQDSIHITIPGHSVNIVSALNTGMLHTHTG